MPAPRLVSLEFTVPDLEACVQLFGGVLGLEILGPERHGVLDAEIAQVVAGEVVITLICPTDTGQGVPHNLPEPRLSQLNFEVVDGALDDLRTRLETAGAPVIDKGSLFVVDPELAKGMLGADTALVFTPGHHGPAPQPEPPGGVGAEGDTGSPGEG